MDVTQLPDYERFLEMTVSLTLAQHLDYTNSFDTDPSRCTCVYLGDAMRHEMGEQAKTKFGWFTYDEFACMEQQLKKLAMPIACKRWEKAMRAMGFAD